jgi:phosphoribosylamine-glycine ligase
VKLLIHSIAGDGVVLAQQCAQEGHEVMLYLAGKKSKLYDGLLYKTDDWETMATQSDVVIFDANGMGGRAEGLRERGIKVWNGGKLADALEKDRGFGMKAFEKCGIPIPETFWFKTGKEATEIVNASFSDADRMVIKLDDFGACATSYVAKDKLDMLAQLGAWQADPHLANLEKGGIIQRFVEGTEISIEGWFNGERFMYPFNVTMEDKCLLNDNLGPNTGCSQNIVWQLRSEHPRLARMIEPLAPLLKKGKFIGQIDVNTIVADDGSGAYALEFTPRAGYDATPTLTLGLAGYGDAVAAALNGEDRLPLDKRPWDFLAAVRCWIPPYPFESTSPKFNGELYDQIRGVPIEGWDISNRNVVLYDAMQVNGNLQVAGTSGVVYMAIGSGRTVEQASAECYKHIEDVQVPNLGFRTDCGARVLKSWSSVCPWVKA